MKKDHKTIGIFTNFQEFKPGYSLTGIAVDQALMLLRNGHKVCMFVNERFNKEKNKEAGIQFLEDTYPNLFFVIKKSKFMHLTDYETQTTLSESHKRDSIIAAQMYTEEIVKHDIDICYTHDFIFVGWNLPYSLAVKAADNMLKKIGKMVYWLHWIHSVPSPEGKDWWDINTYGDNHLIVFPNNVEVVRVAESFNTNPSRIRIIPHIKDIRSWYEFSQNSWNFIDRYPNILQSNVVQVYPCSTDRLSAKQLELVIKIFGYMKKAKVKVFLCAANQWATGRHRKEDVNKYIDLAEYVGLRYGEDFVFTSEYSTNQNLSKIIKSASDFEDLEVDLNLGGYPEVSKTINKEKDFEEEKTRLLEILQPYSTGIDKRMLRELQLLSNVFIFPTREESFGLVGPESSFSGALVVSNKSLSMMYEVLGTMAPAFEFGSHHQTTPAVKSEKYIKGVSFAILNRIYSNEAIMTKTYTKNRYNMDSIYQRYYLPFAV